VWSRYSLSRPLASANSLSMPSHDSLRSHSRAATSNGGRCFIKFPRNALSAEVFPSRLTDHGSCQLTLKWLDLANSP
jgi:hypothetical protein